MRLSGNRRTQVRVTINLTNHTCATLLECELGESRAAPPVCLRPWAENPYGLVSLWDMERFEAGSLHAALAALENTRITHAAMSPPGDATAARFLGQQKILNDDERTGLHGLLVWMENQLRDSGLPTSAEALVDFQRSVKSARALSAAIVAHDLEELQKTIQREMRTVVFLSLASKLAV